jgi:hypothetical protein
MNRKGAALSFTVLLSILVIMAFASPETPVFNFPKGAEWTYKGVVKWAEYGKEQQKTIEWKMWILDKIERSDGIHGYVMKGHPSDLTFYDPDDTKPGRYLYIAIKNCVYRVMIGYPSDISSATIERLKNSKDDLADWMRSDNMEFDFPLVQGKKYGRYEGILERKDDMYCWVVEEQKRILRTVIKGVDAGETLESMLSMRTNSDAQFVSYRQGLGITRYQYIHHGTLSEVDVKLIEYNPGATKDPMIKKDP